MKLSSVFKILPTRKAYAHCDIPCGIYDPTPSQMAAHTVVRMVQLLQEAEKKEDTVAREHEVARLTRVKEKHGEGVEEEIGTLENDYFKEEHYAKYPTLKKTIEETVKLSIKVRQTIDMNASLELLEKVLQIAEIFYKTKNVTPVRVKSIYPTELEIVTYTA